MTNNNKNGRGFASMNNDKQQKAASKGGKSTHEKGTAHEFNSNEARETGRKDGQSSNNQS